MPIPAIGGLTMLSARDYFGNLARTNLFQVFIEPGWGTASNGSTPFLDHLANTTLYYGVNWNSTFKTRLSLLCSEATLPTSTYATAEVKDNFMGVSQEFAHTRINTDIDFTFYVDSNYHVLAFFESWMDYVSGGNSDQTTPTEPSLYTDLRVSQYYRRFNYPRFYKNESGFYIKKFEKNWTETGSTSITYQLINAFPKSVSSIPIAYGEAEIMKVTVTMNYDRYRLFREFSAGPTIVGSVQNADGSWTIDLLSGGTIITQTVSNAVYQAQYAPAPPVP
jgi:hypothetical protein